MYKLIIFAIVGTFLASCSLKESLKSIPVDIKTPEGPVTCQHYTKSRVLWDEAILKPINMSQARADEYCLAEGERRKFQTDPSD